MQNKYIGILICRSLNQDNCPLMNAEDVAYLVKQGYMDKDNNLTDKSQSLLSSIQICSEIFEDSQAVKKEASQVIEDMKKTFEGMFNTFRNNASGMFQSMADNIKVKN